MALFIGFLPKMAQKTAQYTQYGYIEPLLKACRPTAPERLLVFENMRKTAADLQHFRVVLEADALAPGVVAVHP